MDKEREELYDRIEKDHISLMSEMAVTPIADIETFTFDSIKGSLEACEFIEDVELSINEEYGSFDGSLQINGEFYTISIMLEKFEDNGFYEYVYDMSKIYKVSDIELSAVKKANGNILLMMDFASDARISYLYQLEILKQLTKQAAVIVDLSASRLLSMTQVDLILENETLPPLNILYNVHYVYDDNGYYWLHTHGLHRCGLIEFEIVKIRENITEFANILTTMADRCLQDGLSKRDETVVVGHLPMCNIEVKWTPWEEALEQLNKHSLFKKSENFCGNYNDRNEHDGPSGILYAFYENKYQPLNVYTKMLEDNPIFMLSNRETKRMSDYAKHALHHFRTAYSRQHDDEDFLFLIKAGIPCEGENVIGSDHEHMWFEINELNEKSFVGKLINEPYNVTSMELDGVYEVEFDKMTDYLIMRKDKESLDPNNIYKYYIEYPLN